MVLGVGVVLVEILTVIVMIDHICTSKVIAASSDSEEENSLSQALYLVKLLKADYSRTLREEEELDTNLAYDESNSTCPKDEYNLTTSITPGVKAGTPTMTIGTTANPLQSAAGTANTAFTKSNLYKPLVTEQISNILAPNIDTGAANADNAYPYSGNRRAGMEDIAGPHLPMQPGNYRRFNYMPQQIYQQGEETLYEKEGVFMPQPYLQPGYRRAEAEVSPVGDPPTTGTVTLATIAPKPDKTEEVKRLKDNNISPQGEVANETMSAVNTANETTTAVNSSGKSTDIVNTEKEKTTTNETTGVVNTEKGKTTTNKTTLVVNTEKGKTTTNKTTAVVNTAKRNTTTNEKPGVLNSKAGNSNKVITVNGTNYVRTSANEATGAVDTEKTDNENTAEVTTEDVSEEKNPTGDQVALMVASELSKEARETTLPDEEPPVTFKTTMKIFLKRSSRLHIPFSENNAFCHLYPHNKLCSAGI